jgi:hypothetical protein
MMRQLGFLSLVAVLSLAYCGDAVPIDTGTRAQTLTPFTGPRLESLGGGRFHDRIYGHTCTFQQAAGSSTTSCLWACLPEVVGDFMQANIGPAPGRAYTAFPKGMAMPQYSTVNFYARPVDGPLACPDPNHVREMTTPIPGVVRSPPPPNTLSLLSEEDGHWLTPYEMSQIDVYAAREYDCSRATVAYDSPRDHNYGTLCYAPQVSDLPPGWSVTSNGRVLPPVAVVAPSGF